MRRSTRFSLIGVLFAALWPVTAGGYGVYDYMGDRGYHPYARSTEGKHRPGSLRLQTGMTGDGYYVRAWLEGLDPGELQVYLRGNRLVLQIARSDRTGVQRPDARRVSRWQMRFRRQLRLPYDADRTGMTTRVKNGIMEIHIPRRHRYIPTDPAFTR
jgi:HSP20 family molecular chaperone IbpA